jgi:hypothetical protein
VLYQLPKGADLHSHASGAEYIEHALKFSLENGYNYNVDEMVIFDPNGYVELPVPVEDTGRCNYSYREVSCAISIEDLINKQSELNLYLNTVSNRGSGLEDRLPIDHFFNVFKHIKVPNRTVEHIANTVYRNYDQQVRYLELMTAVVDREIIRKVYNLLPKEKFLAQSYEESYYLISDFLNGEYFSSHIKKSMDKKERDLNDILLSNYSISISGEYPDSVVRYIPQLFRTQDPYYTFLDAAINIKASEIDERIVAVNLVHRESAITSQMYFNTQMEILNFFWNKLGKPNISLHAGELTLQESPVEAMRDRISQSILTGKASRIGHGVSIGWERNLSEVLTYMRKNDVAIEICLSSNESVLGLKAKDHPLLLYLKSDVPITLATDDEGVFRSNLTMEYAKAFQEHGLSYSQLKEIARNGLKYSFLDGEGIYTQTGVIKSKYKQYLQGMIPSQYAVGTKAYLQIRFERDLIKFENTLLAKQHIL